MCHGSRLIVSWQEEFDSLKEEKDKIEAALKQEQEKRLAEQQRLKAHADSVRWPQVLRCASCASAQERTRETFQKLKDDCNAKAVQLLVPSMPQHVLQVLALNQELEKAKANSNSELAVLQQTPQAQQKRVHYVQKLGLLGSFCEGLVFLANSTETQAASQQLQQEIDRLKAEVAEVPALKAQLAEAEAQRTAALQDAAGTSAELQQQLESLKSEAAQVPDLRHKLAELEAGSESTSQAQASAEQMQQEVERLKAEAAEAVDARG
ncbi:unnamed protein product, partial [Symbiodinium pilosum]